MASELADKNFITQKFGVFLLVMISNQAASGKLSNT
jgi:hypothetical protein